MATLKKITNSIPDILVFSFVGFLLFFKLGQDYTHVDQFLWLQRSENFREAIATSNFSETYQQYHPGVTLMYLISAGQILYKQVTGDASISSQISVQNFSIYNFWTKLPVVVFIFGLAILCYYFLQKLFLKAFAMIFLVILFIEPFFLGISRNLHLDGILSLLIFTTLLSLYYSLKIGSKKAAIGSGILLGLSLLTKSPAAIILPFSILVFLLAGKLKNYKLYLTFFGVGILTVFVLFPALWVNPAGTIQKIYNEGVLDVGASTGHNHYLNNILLTQVSPEYSFTEFKFRTTPQLFAFVLLSVPAFLVWLALNRKKLKGKFNEAAPFLLSLLFVASYLYIIFHLQKKNDRYLAPAFPFMALTATYFFYFLLNLISSAKSNTGVLLVKAGVWLISIVSYGYFGYLGVFKVFPNLFAYYSPYFGGISVAKEIIYLNQGGTAMPEVAKYISSLNLPPEAVIATSNEKDLNKWTPLKVKTFKFDQIGTYDVSVIPLQRDTQYKKGAVLVHTVNIDGEPYWRIYVKKDVAAKLNLVEVKATSF